MANNAKEMLAEAQANGVKLGQANKDLTQAFMGKLAPVALGDGALTHREKELIALGMAITSRCEYCIVLHVDKALKAGVTREEIGEVCGVAALMGGGPALMYSGRAMAIVDELMAD
jgi:AhpD family alkylhydroperoxidase